MDESVREDVQMAIRLLHKEIDNPSDFAKHSSCFLFGTENQQGINDVVGYKDKTILMPAASGDQYISGRYYGAKNVDIFDINRLTYYITCLKIAAIVNLGYREFLAFFIPLDEHGKLKSTFWSLSVLKRLIREMPERCAYFWSKIMYEAHKNGFEELTILSFTSHRLDVVKKHMPFYASEEEYYKLQGILRQSAFPNFVESDIRALGEVLNSKYDVVYLSNIIECLVVERLNSFYRASYGTENIVEQEFAGDILKAVLPILKGDGTVLMDYRMNRTMRDSGDWLFNNDFFEATDIPCKMPIDERYNRYAATDLVLTYKPIKKGNFLEHI